MFSLIQVGHCSLASLEQPGVSQVVELSLPSPHSSGFMIFGRKLHKIGINETKLEFFFVKN